MLVNEQTETQEFGYQRDLSDHKTTQSFYPSFGVGLAGLFDPFAQRWFYDRSRIKVYEKARRIGITYSTAAEAVAVASSKRGMSVYYMCHKAETAKEFMEACAKFVEAINESLIECGMTPIIKNPRNDVGITRIRFASGFKIQLISSKPNNFRAIQGYAILDEFAFLPNPAEALKSAMGFLVRGGRIAIISTHNGEQSFFNEIVNDIRAGRRKSVHEGGMYSLHRTTLIDAVNDGFYKRLCWLEGWEWSPANETQYVADLLAEPGADQEFMCVPTKAGKNYFPRDIVEPAMRKECKVVHLHQQDDFLHRPIAFKNQYVENVFNTQLLPIIKFSLDRFSTFVGWDFARVPKGDLSVVSFVCVRQDMVRETPLIIEMRGIPYAEQKSIVARCCRALGSFSKLAIDATGSGEGIAEEMFLMFGDTVERVKISDETYTVMLPRLKDGFERQKLTIPLDVNILGDFTAVTLKNGSPFIPRVKDDFGGSRHGDSVIAMMLAYYYSVTDQKPVGFHRAPSANEIRSSRRVM